VMNKPISSSTFLTRCQPALAIGESVAALSRRRSFVGFSKREAFCSRWFGTQAEAEWRHVSGSIHVGGAPSPLRGIRERDG
jgi:hypothetical protein